MRILFMGTASFAVPSLRTLIMAGYDVIGVFTQPDRAKGRGKKVLPGPVKELALEFGLDVYQPERIKDPEAIKLIRLLSPDLIVVVAYGQILPPEVLELPPLGCVNVHASLLPAYRGAAPVQRAIMAGERVSGVTTMFMDKGLDTGDMILRREVALPEDADGGQIYNLLAEEGAKLLLDTVQQIEWGTAPRIPQNPELATYAPPLTREDEIIDFRKKTRDIINQIRALSPDPGATVYLEGNAIKVYKAEPAQGETRGEPGEIIGCSPKEGLIVRTGDGQVRLSLLQRPGKKRITDQEFLCGCGNLVGKRFGSRPMGN